jgi:iron complex transport system ATP-binding protein
MTDSKPGDVLLEAAGIGWESAGVRIVGPIDLGIARGESVSLVGPNGAGKTTLLRLLVGVLRPASGEARWRRRPLPSIARRELARHVAYVPQVRPARVPFSVRQLVMLGRYPYLSPLQLAPREADFAAVARAIELVDLADLVERRVDELSGGERQAVYIAAALAQESEMLVLDEPTTHLDPRHQRRIARLLLRLHREEGKSILMATHDLNLASRVASRVVALRDGWVIGDGDPSALLRPGPLGELFEAPFDLVRDGEHPVTILDLER